MEGTGIESLLIRESVRKLYSHARKDYDMEANVPHWVRTLVHLFKGLSVEVKTIHNNNNNSHNSSNSSNSSNNNNNNTIGTATASKPRIELDPNSCCIHDELMKNVMKEKEQFQERIASLGAVIEDNKTHSRRNCLLVSRIKEMGFDGSSNELYNTIQRLNQFEAKCRSYEDLCDKVVKEKCRIEQKVELLEEVIDEFGKFTRCSCLIGSHSGKTKVKDIVTDDERSLSENSATMVAAR